VPTDREQLQRLRVAIATGRLPTDVGLWALEQSASAMAATERRRWRDELLREAARYFGGSDWSKANKVHRMLQAFLADLARTELAAFPVQTPEHCVQAALRLDSDPPGFRQVLRIVASDIEGA